MGWYRLYINMIAWSDPIHARKGAAQDESLQRKDHERPVNMGNCPYLPFTLEEDYYEM